MVGGNFWMCPGTRDAARPQPVVRSRSPSISIKRMVASASSGKLKISPSKFLAKTVLPAPMNAIVVILYLQKKFTTEAREHGEQNGD
jgi:hypothetical protein